MSRRRPTKSLWITSALVTVAVTNAAPAVAGDDEYLDLLQDRYRFLTPQQLLAEGHRACQIIDQGTGSSYAAEVVQRDLSVSPGAAMDIVSAATVELGC